MTLQRRSAVVLTDKLALAILKLRFDSLDSITPTIIVKSSRIAREKSGKTNIFFTAIIFGVLAGGDGPDHKAGWRDAESCTHGTWSVECSMLDAHRGLFRSRISSAGFSLFCEAYSMGRK